MHDEPPLDLTVVRAQRGDRAAFRELYERHVDAVFGYCLAFARGDRDRAADLAQDAFITAFSALDDLDDPARFSGWLRTIVRRTCLRWVQRRQTEGSVLARMADEPDPGPLRDDRGLARAVREVIAACPDPGLRAAAELFYTEPPHSTAEIAARLGLSQTAVTTRLHRFRSWARQQMVARLALALEDAS